MSAKNLESSQFWIIRIIFVVHLEHRAQIRKVTEVQKCHNFRRSNYCHKYRCNHFPVRRIDLKIRIKNSSKIRSGEEFYLVYKDQIRKVQAQQKYRNQLLSSYPRTCIHSLGRSLSTVHSRTAERSKDHLHIDRLSSLLGKNTCNSYRLKFRHSDKIPYKRGDHIFHQSSPEIGFQKMIYLRYKFSVSMFFSILRTLGI